MLSKEVKEMVGELTPMQMQELKMLLNNEIDELIVSNNYTELEIKGKKVIVGFDNWEELVAKIDRIRKKGKYNCKVVEVKQIGSDEYEITNNVPNKEYDVKEIVDMNYNDFNGDFKVFDYREEIDNMKQSVEYHWGEEEWDEAATIQRCFADVCEQYYKIDTDNEILIHDGSYVEYKVISSRTMNTINYITDDSKMTFIIGLLLEEI